MESSMIETVLFALAPIVAIGFVAYWLYVKDGEKQSKKA